MIEALGVYMLTNMSLFHVLENLKSQVLEVAVNYIAPLFVLAPGRGVRFAGRLTSN